MFTLTLYYNNGNRITYSSKNKQSILDLAEEALKSTKLAKLKIERGDHLYG